MYASRQRRAMSDDLPTFQDNGEKVMKTLLLRFLRTVGFAGLAAATVVGPAVPAGRSQEKSTPVSKVERLNRAPVNKEALRVQLPRPTVVKLPNGLTLLFMEPSNGCLTRVVAGHTLR